MNLLHCHSPAKLNLFLHIIKQRLDGYHELQTVFQLLNYYDELEFSLRTDRKIQLIINKNSSINLKKIGALNNNLITRAARLLQTTHKINLGVDITLTKHIPIGGGLGGGSSNAATTLLALNKLWQLNLDKIQLAQLGLQLGADIPVFVHGYSAWGEGIGEKLTPIELSKRWYVVLVPPCSINTTEIFSTKELTRDTSPITIQRFLSGVVATRNDCEPVVIQHYPIIAEALNWLNQFASAHLTGTGCCVFAAFNTKAEAQKIAQQIPGDFQGFVAQGINKFNYGGI